MYGMKTKNYQLCVEIILGESFNREFSNISKKKHSTKQMTEIRSENCRPGDSLVVKLGPHSSVMGGVKCKILNSNSHLQIPNLH